MTTDSHFFHPPVRRSGVTVWRRIADSLAQDIRNRRFSESGRLPSEAELSARFGVNRHTLRQAIQSLQASGLVRVEQGRGMFVQQELVHYPLARRTRFSENLARQGLLAGKQWLSAREEAATAHVARELGLDRGAAVVFLEAVSEANGEPINLMKAWYPAGRLPGLMQRVGGGRPTSEVLAELGLPDYLRAWSRITTQLPSDETARLLKQPVTRPVLCVESLDTDVAGVPVKYGETLFCGDRVQLEVCSKAFDAVQ